ncbi:uncharacterized protein LOC111195013 [Astyanax mexicanus]|uniref:uncharacterized protein LOC111195013 n=1 Tax=Astyanax mexicanus TaxID=7994 RepID=UPI0020CB1046|nr:uncharacterized protein LOC111195013 [Astyanax mexicanus]
MARVSMYCFLCFILLMRVEGQEAKENSNKTMEASTFTNKTTPISLTPSEDNLAEHTSGKPTSRSQQTSLSTTYTASPNPTEPTCHLCVEHLTKPLPLIVIGALGITCFTLLMTTLVQACHLCCLKRQISRGYQVCSDTTQSAVQPTVRAVSVDCEQPETRIMMNEISNGKPEGEEIQAEPKQPEKPEEAAKEVQEAEVTNQDTTEDFTQNEMPEVESPPDQDFPAPIDDTV